MAYSQPNAHIRSLLRFEKGRAHVLYFGHREVEVIGCLMQTPSCISNLSKDRFKVKNLSYISFWLAGVGTVVGGI
jgi:hypothetical protein